MDKVKRILLITWRVLRNTAIILTTLLFVGLAMLRSKWVQNKLIPIVENIVENATGAEVSVGMVDIGFPLDAVLRDVKMYDQQGEKMFSVESVRASMFDLSLFGLIFNSSGKKTLRISRIYIDHPEAFLYKNRADSLLNLAFLTNRPPKEQPDTTPSQMDILLPNIHIHQGRFRYQDRTKPDSLLTPTRNLNFANLDVGRIQCNFSVAIEGEAGISGHLDDFKAVEGHTQAVINHLTTDFLIRSYKGMREGTQICLDQTSLKAGRTELDLDGSLDMYKLAGDSVSALWTDLYLRPSTFDFVFLSYLSPKPIPLKGLASIEGPISGDLEKLSSDRLKLGLGEDTHLLTSLELSNFTKPDFLAWELDISPPSTVGNGDIRNLLVGSDYPLNGTLGIQGGIKGNMRRIKGKDLRLTYKNQTALLVDARVYEYTRSDDMVLDLRFDNSEVSIQELHEIMPETPLPEFLYRFGKLRIDGNFIGGLQDFVVNADFFSDLGDIRSDLHLIRPKRGSLAYNGNLELQGLDVSALQIAEVLEGTKVNFVGNINGFGTDYEIANLKLKGNITNSQLLGYDIDTLTIREVTILDKTIKGYLDLHDREGSAHVYGKFKPQEDSLYAMTLQGNLDSLELDHYGMGEHPFEYSGIVDVKLTGSELEDVTGRIKLFETRFLDKADSSRLVLEDDVYIRAVRNDSIKEIRFDGGLVEGTLTGHFYFKEGQALMSRMVKEVGLFIRNNQAEIDSYYVNKVIKASEDLIVYNLETQTELNKTLAFFKVPLGISNQAQISGNFTGLDEDLLTLSVVADTFRYADIRIKSPDITLGLVKPAKLNKIQGGGEANLERFQAGAASFDKLNFSFEVDSNQVDYELNAIDPQIGNVYRILAQTTFTYAGIFSSVNPRGSFVKVRGEKWAVTDNNYIAMYQYPRFQIEVNDLVFRNKAKKVGVYGIASDRVGDTLYVDAAGLDIASLVSYFSDSIDVGGKLNGLRAKIPALLGDELQVIYFAAADELRYGTGIDSLRSTVRGNYTNGQLYSLLQVGYQENDNALVMYGTLQTDSLKMDFESIQSDIPLAWATPFVTGIVSDIEGKAVVDKFDIKGTPSQLYLKGNVLFQRTQFKLDMFNNYFRIAENSVLEFDKSKINFPGNGLILTDTSGNPAIVHGSLVHSGIGAPSFDIRVDTIQNMTFMNTFPAEDSPYYGFLRIANGNARITGNADLIDIKATATTGKDTRLNIPLSDYTSASRLEFVDFVGPQGKIEVKDSGQAAISGLNLDLRVQATPEATVRLIFDEQTGDIIEAKGGGNIGLVISPDGEFSMDGAYELTEGNYLFTVSNVVNKRFRVKPGSRITWSGEPYNAQLNVDAVYAVKANLKDLLPQLTTNSKIPVFVIMHMTGSLLAPSISLELQLDELGGEDVAGLASYFRNIQYDEQELNRQVVSLLVLGKFATPSSGSNEGAATAGVTSSLSELVSNQLNNWISQAFDSNLGVELNTNNFEDVELGFKYSFLDDRITIERNGTLIGNQTGRFSIGDLSMQIKILPVSDSTGELKVNQGQLIFEIFNRESPGINNTFSITSGGGIFYKKDFDRLFGILRKKEK